MKLQEWFRLKTQRPLKMILIVFLALWASFALFEIHSQREEIKRRLFDFDRQISLAVSQSNRPLLESIIENAFHQFNADSIALCVDGRMEIEINTKNNLCSGSHSFGTFSKEVNGFHNMQLVVKSFLKNRLIIYLFVLLFILVVSLYVIKLLNDLKKDLYKDMIEPLGQLFGDDYQLQIEELQNIRNKLKDAIAIEKNLIHANAIVSLSKQVAHDIRSPLSALTIVSSSLTHIPEDKRLLIRNATQRINDIANDLLRKSQKMDEAETNNTISMETESCQSLTVEFLPALVDSLVSEKRIQYREYKSLEIETELKNSFGAFANINSKELKRVISNLVNNAVEAFDKFQGKVTVGVRKIDVDNSSYVEVFVKDDGRGIPKYILEKLGQKGVTAGKTGTQSGSGLGIYHAKLTAESFGGTLQIESIEEQGTIIRIVLPSAETPKWFASKIDLSGKKYLVSLDDDVSIHQIWSGRLQGEDLKEVTHVKFQSGEAFEQYVNSNINKLKSTVFLIDFELLNQQKTGLDIIEDLGIEKYSVLVTSRYEEPSIKERALRLRLPLLPKGLAGFVPFTMAVPAEKYDWVLLDDDDLVHMSWSYAAKETNSRFIGFRSISDFEAYKSKLDPSSNIYIDSSLGEAIRGEEIAKKLFEEGFRNLYLATGYSAEQFEPMDFIRAIVGKEPPRS